MTPDQPKALATQRVSISDQLQALYEWMREPDWAEEFTHADIAAWINKRRCHTPLTARARIAELEAERDRALAWCDNANQAAGEFSDREMAAEKRADRLAAELAEAKATGRKEGLREADGIARNQYSAFPTRSLAKDALDCVIDAIRARLSAAEPTKDTHAEPAPRSPG